jgi:hypothetical protein
MKVEYRPLQDSLLDACRNLAIRCEDETFSAQQVADFAKVELPHVLKRLDWLQENEWIVRISNDWKDELSPDELWCLHEQHLTSGRLYEVLGIEDGYYRILKDETDANCPNDPLLYSLTGFIIQDPAEPTFWVKEVGPEGERSCYPPEWMATGFWEDYHDGVDTVIAQFWDDVRRYYPWTWKERKGDR